MELIPNDHPQILAAQEAIVNGDIDGLSELLSECPWLPTARIDNLDSQTTLLHCATDWPGKYPNVDQTIKHLVNSGADVNSRVRGPAHNETPLIWAASSNDIVAVNALVECGADLEMDGSVTDGGTALSAAVNFGNWEVANRLVELGAETKLFSAAALGMKKRVQELLNLSPSKTALNYAFWMACSQGETEVGEILYKNGCEINWIPDWDSATALDESRAKGRKQAVEWLLQIGGKSATQILEH